MGPLHGLKVLEIEAIGPVPWAGMMLSDLGADVLRIDRPAPPALGLGRDPRLEITARGRRSLVADLKQPQDLQTVLQLAGKADVLLEGMRPGVMERLGLGPDACLARNPKLVYGRMTGWGQHGPLAQEVGHDINYIATAGVLGTMGRANEPPMPPLNLVGDFGGGAMLLLVGVLAGLLEARSSGRGQVVDAAMVDGSLALLAPVIGRFQGGDWKAQRESNLLDGGAPFYRTYATSDAKAVAVGALEPRFYAALLQGLGLAGTSLPKQQDRAAWPALRERFASIFAGETRQHWQQRFAGTEACVSPVLTLDELAQQEHLRARGSLVEIDGVLQPAPAPRFSRTQGGIQSAPAARGTRGEEALAEWLGTVPMGTLNSA